MASTEFQRASQALEELEARLDELAPPSDEAADWVLLASTSAAERDISEPQRQAFADAEDRLDLLSDLCAKMRRKIEAHTELAELQSWLAGRTRSEEAPPAEALSCRLQHLQSTATYGQRMLEKVVGLLERYDAARARFAAEVVPRFAAPATAVEVDEALKHLAAQREAQAAQRRREAELGRPVAELLARSEQKLQELREAQQVSSEWLCVQELSLADFGVCEAKSVGGQSMYS